MCRSDEKMKSASNGLHRLVQDLRNQHSSLYCIWVWLYLLPFTFTIRIDPYGTREAQVTLRYVSVQSTAGYTLHYGMLYVFEIYIRFHEYSSKYRVDVEDGQTEGRENFPECCPYPTA